MNILGVSAYYHDSAACLVQDGEIVAAAQEKRERIGLVVDATRRRTLGTMRC